MPELTFFSVSSISNVDFPYMSCYYNLYKLWTQISFATLSILECFPHFPFSRIPNFFLPRHYNLQLSGNLYTASVDQGETTICNLSILRGSSFVFSLKAPLLVLLQEALLCHTPSCIFYVRRDAQQMFIALLFLLRSTKRHLSSAEIRKVTFLNIFFYRHNALGT